MSELVPLLASSTDEFELALLRSTDRDELSSEGLLKTAVVLGLGSSLTLSAANASPLIAYASKLPVWQIVVKWIGFGILSGAVLSEAGVLLGTPAPLASATAPEIMTRALPTAGVKRIACGSEPPSAAEPTTPIVVASPSTVTRAVPSEIASPSEPSKAASAVSSVAAFAPLAGSDSAGDATSITEQVQLIDGARRSLAEGSPRAALQAIHAYHQRWPNGTLDPEATVLDVRAQKMLGDDESAERDARALIERDPNSRYAAQLRALLGVTAEH